jgi:cell division protein FtsB
MMKLAEQIRSLCRRHATALLVLALLALLLQDIFGAHGVLAMRRSQKEVEQIQREIKQLNDQNCELEHTVNALKTDPKEIERIAREDMGLARQGEYIFKLAPKSGDPSAPGGAGTAGCPAPEPATK